MTNEIECTGVKVLDPVDGLVGYVEDVKPYHTKIVEVLVEYVFGEPVDVTILEDPHLQIDIARPSEPFVAFSCDDGYSSRPYGGPSIWPVLSPNQSIPFETYPAINASTNSFTVPGDRTDDFSSGTEIQLITFVEDYEHVFDIVDINSGPAGTGFFVIDDGVAPNDFATNHPVWSGSPIAGHAIEAFGTTADDNRQFIVTNIVPASPSPGLTTVYVAQAVLSQGPSGKLGMVRSVGNNTGTFTVIQSGYSKGFIDSWPGYPVPSTYEIGDDPHTIVTVSGSLNTPSFNPSTETYAAFVRLKPLQIERVLSYSNASAEYDLSIPDFSQTPDEGYLRRDIISVTPSSLDGFGNAIPDSGKIVVRENLEVSNIFIGDDVRIFGSTGNNGTYTITSISYDLSTGETILGVQEHIVSSTADGVIQIDVPSNVFIVDGNHSSRFSQGTRFEVVGGSYAGRYTTLTSDFYNGKTRVRTTKDIVNVERGYRIQDVTSGFVVRGDRTPDFPVGSQFNIVGSSLNDGSYTVASATYVDYEGSPSVFVNQSTIVPNETIATITGSPTIEIKGEIIPSVAGMIKESLLGFGESSDFCDFNPEGIVRVKIHEQLSFDGLGLDLHDDIIAYNLENNDTWGYELPLETTFGTTQPSIPSQSFAPASPTTNDLWFNTSIVPIPGVTTASETLHIWNGYKWKSITTAWWLDTDTNLLYYRTKTKYVDTNWVLALAEPPGFSSIQPAIGKTILLGTETFTVEDEGGTPQSTFEFTSLTVPSSGSPPEEVLVEVTINGVPADFVLDSPTQFTLVDVPVWDVGDIVEASVYQNTNFYTTTGITLQGSPPSHQPYSWDYETNADVQRYGVEAHKVFHRDVDILSSGGSPASSAYVLYGGNYVNRFIPENRFDVWKFTTPGSQLATHQTTTFPIVDVDDENQYIFIYGEWTWLFATGRIISVRTSGNNYQEFEIGDATVVGSPTLTQIQIQQPDVVESPAESPTDPIQYFYNPGVEIVQIDNVSDTIIVRGDVSSSYSVGMKIRVTNSTSGNNGIWTVGGTTYFPPLGSPPTATDLGQTGIALVENIPDIDTSGSSLVHTPIHQNYSRDLGVIVGAVYDPVLTGSPDIDVKTYVVPTTPVDTDAEGITYTWIGPLRIEMAIAHETQISTTFLDGVSASHEMMITADQTGTPPKGVASTFVTEDLNFGWGMVHRWNIIGTDSSSNTIYLAGDVTGALDNNDRASITGSAGNDGDYEIGSFVYNIGLNRTEIALTSDGSPSGLIVDPPGSPQQAGYFTLKNIDVTNWFQYLIKEARPERGSPPTPVNVFEVNGNATGDVQNGQQFRVMGTTNDGVYTVSSSPTFDPDSGTTDIPVVETIPNTERGGWVESHRDYGIRLILEDHIGISAGEDVTGSVLATAGNLVDAWDYNYWDLGAFDEELGQVIHLYSNTF